MVKNSRRSQGFTLIELVMVMVLMSILIAVAIPKYNNLTTSGETASKAAAAGAVRSAFNSYAAANAGAAPTVAQLAGQLTGTACTAVNTGIQCTLKNGTVFIVLTYTNSTCTTATAATTNVVACIAG